MDDERIVGRLPVCVDRLGLLSPYDPSPAPPAEPLAAFNSSSDTEWPE